MILDLERELIEISNGMKTVLNGSCAKSHSVNYPLKVFCKILIT